VPSLVGLGDSATKFTLPALMGASVLAFSTVAVNVILEPVTSVV
jgi:hypothetical protein